MVKKTDEEDFEDELEEEEEEEEAEEEKPKKKVKAKIGKDWVSQRTPEFFTVVNPKTKEVIAQALTLEELNLQLNIIAAQKSTEAAKNTE